MRSLGERVGGKKPLCDKMHSTGRDLEKRHDVCHSFQQKNISKFCEVEKWQIQKGSVKMYSHMQGLGAVGSPQEQKHEIQSEIGDARRCSYL